MNHVAGNAAGGSPCRRRHPTEQGAALEPDIAADRPVEPAQTIEQCNLVGAIGPDQPKDLSFVEIERNAVERHDADKAHHDVADF